MKGQSEEDERKNEKIVKLRVNIGFCIFFILLVLVIFEYISYNFMFMISIPMIAIISLWNSFSDKTNNDSRVIILAILLAFFSFNFYSLQIKNTNLANKVHKICNEKLENTMLCDEIFDILIPQEDDT